MPNTFVIYRIGIDFDWPDPPRSSSVGGTDNSPRPSSASVERSLCSLRRWSRHSGLHSTCRRTLCTEWSRFGLQNKKKTTRQSIRIVLLLFMIVAKQSLLPKVFQTLGHDYYCKKLLEIRHNWLNDTFSRDVWECGSNISVHGAGWYTLRQKKPFGPKIQSVQLFIYIWLDIQLFVYFIWKVSWLFVYISSDNQLFVYLFTYNLINI